jgi:hypothetical protein
VIGHLLYPAVLGSTIVSRATGTDGNRDANHVPGVVLTGIVIGTLLLWAAVRSMFGKKKK